MVIKCFREPQNHFGVVWNFVQWIYLMQIYVRCTFSHSKEKISNLSSSKSVMQCWMSIKRTQAKGRRLYHGQTCIKSTNFKIILTKTEVNNFPLHQICHTFLVLVLINIHFSWQFSYFNLKAANLCIPIQMKKPNGLAAAKATFPQMLFEHGHT